MSDTHPTRMHIAAEALRRAGWLRLAVAYFVVLVMAMFGGEAIFGAAGLGWFRERTNAAAVGVAFVVVWAYLTFLRLGRGEPRRRTLTRTALPALALAVAAGFLDHLLHSQNRLHQACYLTCVAAAERSEHWVVRLVSTTGRKLVPAC